MWKTGRVGSIRDAYDRTRSRYLLKALDAVATSTLSPPPHSSGSPAAAAAHRSMYERVQSAAKRVARSWPGTAERIYGALFSAYHLPFPADCDLTLLNFGSGTTVFLITFCDMRRYVLKVYRYSLGRRAPTLLAQAAEQRAAYRTLCRWYDGCSVVLPTSFLVLNGPLLGRPALGCVQPYIDSNSTRDLFSDISESELLIQLHEHELLRRQFQAFVQCTVDAASNERASADLLGRNNLVLLDDGERTRLQLLDVYIHPFATRQRRAPGSLAHLQLRLAYLRRVRDRIDPLGQ
jgi:hypothetical protein